MMIIGRVSDAIYLQVPVRDCEVGLDDIAKEISGINGL